MSGDEDTELRDLVTQTLENNGVLAKIRAELRASIFLALEEHDCTRSTKLFHNKALKRFLHTTEGVLAASIVKEFLEFFHLDYTKSVFGPESYCNNEICPRSREELVQQLHLQEGVNKVPVLSLLLQCFNNSSDSKESVKSFIPKAAEIVNGNGSLGLTKNDNGCSSQEKSLSNSPFSEAAFSSPERRPHSKRNISTDIEIAPTTNEEPNATCFEEDNIPIKIKVCSSNLKSSNPDSSDIPKLDKKPLDLLSPLLDSTVSRANTKSFDDTKAILDQVSPTSSFENYEEDFQSSVSGSQADMVESKIKGTSVSEEIEEVISDGQSSASLKLEDSAQELTCDTSIGLQISLPDEYLENL